MFFHELVDINNHLRTINVDQITAISCYEDHAVIGFTGGNEQNITVKIDVSRQVKEAIKMREEWLDDQMEAIASK